MNLREMLRDKLPLWYIEKDKYLAAALCNDAYEFEQVRETEKAIEFKITNTYLKKKINHTWTWTKWIPKALLK